MRNVTVIATCLVNQRSFTKLEEAEHQVRWHFNDLFPKADFNDWNRFIEDRVAADIIASVGVAKDIDIERFIRALWR